MARSGSCMSSQWKTKRSKVAPIHPQRATYSARQSSWLRQLDRSLGASDNLKASGWCYVTSYSSSASSQTQPRRSNNSRQLQPGIPKQ
ncbi:hypothetical protein PoB_001829900 [Plakobranchus ocellatus]|uniref:Uncharacterized protein n=1 Tax=Plakobranchus ocellatus TaxID=259542 RepID=A0AAV3ZD29_9GAST|nr:hypothetical protein PoB_001829900 [Plakobranchus ocellatus]